MRPAAAYRLLALLTLLNVLNFADRYLLVSFSHSIIGDQYVPTAPVRVCDLSNL